MPFRESGSGNDMSAYPLEDYTHRARYSEVRLRLSTLRERFDLSSETAQRRAKFGRRAHHEGE